MSLSLGDEGHHQTDSHEALPTANQCLVCCCLYFHQSFLRFNLGSIMGWIQGGASEGVLVSSYRVQLRQLSLTAPLSAPSSPFPGGSSCHYQGEELGVILGYHRKGEPRKPHCSGRSPCTCKNTVLDPT